MIGQISLWEFISPDPDNEIIEKSEPSLNSAKSNSRITKECDRKPNLSVGDKVWMVTLGDVSEQEVVRSYRLEKEFGYHLSGTTTWDHEIGEKCFLSLEEAKRKAEMFIRTHDVIMGDKIKPIETKRFGYARECDGRYMVAALDLLPEGRVLEKGFMTFMHIVDCGTEDKARKFIKKKAEEDGYTEREAYHGELKIKNMYRCKGGLDWMYAEAGYSGCDGSERYI